MALSLCRVTLSRLASNGSSGRAAASLSVLQQQQPNLQPRRGISGKTMRGSFPRPDKPAPYDYERRSYNFLHFLFDRTTSRFDDNTRLIVVDGPIAAGKSAFARTLADELEMLYLPEANQDMWNINECGFDLRTLDAQLPDSTRSFDVDSFLANPRHRLAASFQIKQMMVKCSQYVDALAHLLSTGQGVVLDRSVYSDFVFAEAMYQCGYMSRAARAVYFEVRRSVLPGLLHPHLVIYLDMAVPRVQENIKRRGYARETGSAALTPKFLETMEATYKQEYLKEMGKHCELLVYDWSEGGEVEVVVEDIERIPFGGYDSQETRMRDWDQDGEDAWATLRHLYADKKVLVMNKSNVPAFHVPELTTSADDLHATELIMDDVPGQMYRGGFNQSEGDSIHFNMKIRDRGTLPRRERRPLA